MAQDRLFGRRKSCIDLSARRCVSDLFPSYEGEDWPRARGGMVFRMGSGWSYTTNKTHDLEGKGEKKRRHVS